MRVSVISVHLLDVGAGDDTAGDGVCARVRVPCAVGSYGDQRDADDVAVGPRDGDGVARGRGVTLDESLVVLAVPAEAEVVGAAVVVPVEVGVRGGDHGRGIGRPGGRSRGGRAAGGRRRGVGGALSGAFGDGRGVRSDAGALGGADRAGDGVGI